MSDNLFCSPVKTSDVHRFSCLYSHTDNVQNEAAILTALRKYFVEFRPRVSSIDHKSIGDRIHIGRSEATEFFILLGSMTKEDTRSSANFFSCLNS